MHPVRWVPYRVGAHRPGREERCPDSAHPRDQSSSMSASDMSKSLRCKRSHTISEST